MSCIVEQRQRQKRKDKTTGKDKKKTRQDKKRTTTSIFFRAERSIPPCHSTVGATAKWQQHHPRKSQNSNTKKLQGKKKHIYKDGMVEILFFTTNENGSKTYTLTYTLHTPMYIHHSIMHFAHRCCTRRCCGSWVAEKVQGGGRRGGGGSSEMAQQCIHAFKTHKNT